MNCRRAHAMMHDALDRKGAPDEVLGQHLQACTACSREWNRLGKLCRLASGTSPCAGDAAEAVTRATARAFANGSRDRNVAPTNRTRALLPHLAWACFALAAFALGHMLRVPQVVERRLKVPVVKESVVRIEVPVYRERVVERVVTREVRVPIVRTRVVYRDRILRVVASQPARATAAVVEAPPAPEPANLVVQTYPTHETPTTATYTETLRLARLITGEAGE